MRLLTIGFTKKPASSFFETLRDADVQRVVDVRLNNVSQLAGFAKKRDLAYFLDRIGDIRYTHATILAPTQELLDEYKKRGGRWEDYEREFLLLMKERQVEDPATVEILDGDCLLCSEEWPEHCHRRLVAEYLASHRSDMDIRHLR